MSQYVYYSKYYSVLLKRDFSRSNRAGALKKSTLEVPRAGGIGESN